MNPGKNRPNKLPSFILMIVLLIGTITGQGQTTIINPILTGFYPDPSIVKVGPDYYLINSTFSYFPGIPVFHSQDLKNWKQIGNVIDRTSQLDFMGERITRGLFAPAISYHKGRFYVTCTDIDHDGNFVVTATNPAGPWSDPVKIPQVRGIDPSLFFDDNDQAYILYNSDAPENKPLYPGHRTIRMYAFDPVTLKVSGEEKQLVNGGVDLSKKPVWIEGPHILRRNNWYYLYAAEGGTSVNHSEVVLRSKSVWGPYIPYDKNPILTQRGLPEDRKHPVTSAGHAQLVEGPDGKTYSIFLAVRPYQGDFYNTGRETFLAPVEWIDDWPVINPHQQEISYQYQVGFPEVKQKKSYPQSGNFSYTVDLRKTWDPSFLFMRKPDSAAFSTSRKSGLVLQLKPETIMDPSNPSFVGKRQQHINSTAEIKFNFTPQSDNESAGLTVFQSETNFYYLAKTKAEGSNVVRLFKANKGSKQMEQLATATLSSGKETIYFRVASLGNTYSFSFSLNGKDWTLLKDKVDGTYVSTKAAGGFVGVLYGMYATSAGQPSSSAASFLYLKYSGNDPMFK